MIAINFYPESDKEELIKAAKEYQEIWKKEGEKIVDAIEKISGFKFKTKIINAVTFEGISYSTPLRLDSRCNVEQKMGVLVHELCHRLLVDINFHFPQKLKGDVRTLELHKIIYLVLYDIWSFLYGEVFADEQVKYEKSFNHKPHVEAWSWALSLTKEQRKHEFKKICGPEGI